MHTDYPSSLNAWLERIEACHPAEIELGLERIRCVAERLAIDLGESRKVLIAGTNGKGSTVTMLDSILRAAGLTTGVYTSPHFLRYNERIRINGDEAGDQLICAQFDRIERARGEIELTYFEYGTLAALLCFADAKPDVLLLEVGLGGRLDAVNIVDCDIAVVTSIALDHTDWLGNDREQIGREKAGIARAGKPLVCGDPEPPECVVSQCAQQGVPLWVRDRDYGLELDGSSWCWWGTGQEREPKRYESLPQPELPVINAATVLQVIELLGLEVTAAEIAEGLGNARMTGRMQRVSLPEGPCILDVAHNPEAAAYMAGWLEQHPVSGRTLLVIGMLADKDIDSVIEQLGGSIDLWFPVSLEGTRGATAQRLAAPIKLMNGQVQAEYARVADALADARRLLEPGDRLLVAGSFVTVTQALLTLDENASN
ncbi:bifunctional folylpolyglutamate synthase/dihydrofolate synthase [Marinobacterium zhoushanense]|uniref:Dihydrofolate synthase/folylpolyglutamate synthase n=1 Tax=Marinobacterium zhoushanense TaxID=1679163 RepID=A0ABQ1K8V6_9GAMM|nr:bifunctional tetrahydrofolate synthase/dihydrofolate synthase [Marinobacterium zhoushanense]GGB90467.1 bifunctional folylpolyglutamate synthase/dihydrofolate synthase [Marinobacterium zhoushanense]